MSAADRALLEIIGAVDRLVPKTRSVVLRTLPDLCDQGRQVARALAGRDVEVTYLVDDVERASRAASDLPCRVLGARSLPGLKAYWRAAVVVHPHGVFGSKPGGRGKRFVNVWHGMPVKLLEQSSIVGRNQTDVTIATSPLHAEHLAETWGLRSDQVAVTGLPRNDLLAGPPPLRPQWLAEVLGERKLVMWLPTFRTGVRRVARAEGVDTGTDTQFEGADAAAVDRLMAELGAHCIVKAHPMAPQPERQDLPNLTILGASHLEELGTTLYELLAHADVLVTDHSSVWIDFLLTGRPMVFTISDREQYAADRGYYFDDLDSLLPGPIVTSFDELAEPLADALAGAAGWKAAREDALALHHVHTDDRSAERVADLIEAQLRT